MSVELTPRGTRGREWPQPLRALMGAMARLNAPLYRLFGNRMRVQGRPILLLTTLGAKSGKIRHTILCWFPDSDDSWLVVASAAGAARHPAWYTNLARHPDRAAIAIGHRRIEVEPESLRGTERAEAWQRVVALAPGYAPYQEQTDREIPIVRLRAKVEARSSVNR
ncbi:MAG TPA: nitroreductase/quinone reductase family protein [Thermomicrobiales bacterium]|nr:nitroreductase/quinone reductase family protein [Thermomicrobiales bacterium]